LTISLLLFLGEAEGAVLARLNRTRPFEANVLKGMTECTASPVAHCHVSVDFDDRHSAHEVEGVAPVLPQLVLMAMVRRGSRTAETKRMQKEKTNKKKN
jgi:hypothetical protein